MEEKNMRIGTSLASLTVAAALAAAPAFAQKKYDTGASDTEIKIGQTMPYSGPASAYGTIGRIEAAYFKMINDQGGINGRKLTLISLDDGYSPPRTVEATRRLVEQDEVLFDFQPLGTAANSAIRKYMNAKKVPQLFVATGATMWGDPKHYPWTMGWQPAYQTEGKIYAKDILTNHPNAKVAVLYQNDDYGKDLLKGLKDGLGAKASSLIVKEASYEVTDPSIDSQILSLKDSGADVFVNITTPKFAALAIRKVYDSGWRPTHYLANVSLSIGAVLTPAGLEKSVGLMTVAYLKDATDTEWENDAAMNDYKAFLKKYYPEGNIADSSNVYGYSAAQTLVQVLKQCGDNLTRENVMKQAASLKHLQLPLARPGIEVNTGPDDFFPFEALQLQRFDGKHWVAFGKVIE
jgi:branched-chain amino acid transport system substrate-binding protein